MLSLTASPLLKAIVNENIERKDISGWPQGSDQLFLEKSEKDGGGQEYK